MTDCMDEEMRDLLPLLAHGSLAADEADRVRAHTVVCAVCGAEFAALETSRLVLRASAPRVDVAAIALAVSRAARPAAPMLRVERGTNSTPATARRSVWRSRQYLAAAASLLIVASLSLRLLDRTPATDEGIVPVDTAAAVLDSPAIVAASPTAISVGASLMDLSSDDLSILLDEIERVDATLTLEPASMRQPIVDAPENF